MMNSQEEDSLLVARAQNGDRMAVERLVRKHQRLVFSLALKFIGNHHDAEEVAQDALVKAIASIHRFQGESRFSTWLYRIVFNTAMSFQRKKRLPLFSIDENDNHSYESHFKADSNIHQQERSSQLRNAIAQLHPTDALLIELFYLGEQQLHEIEEITGISCNTIKVRLFRARQKLALIIDPSLALR